MRAELADVMVKHLPPSGANLRLLDVNGATGEAFSKRRDDLQITKKTGVAASWQLAPDSFDAVAAVDVDTTTSFLATCLKALRPGGRLIVVLSDQSVSMDWVACLEQAGYTRTLVESALEYGYGVLLRGEKPHTEARTVDRIRQVADQDQWAGRYVHLLIRQTPNKPVWALEPGTVIEWWAAAVQGGDGPALLAFSSLPKAVAFMQPAVIQGLIKDVNKVGKFSRETARAWTMPVVVNATLESLAGHDIVYLPVDPTTAELPDE